MSFVLYRILGNDLPPRHRPGQTLSNLRLLLEREAKLPGCEKRWVLNRIVDPAIEAAAGTMIADAGHRVLRIPFVLDEYARLAFDHARPEEEHLHARAFHALPTERRAIILEWCLRQRAHYFTNVNPARNAALAEGRAAARWTLPWDGATFISPDAWSAIRAAAEAAGDARYLAVPLLRSAPDGSPMPAAGIGEPQLAFREDAAETFDESLRYGNSEKAVLLARLGIDGAWSPSEQARFMAARSGPSPDAGRWRWAGAVLRLPSGNDAADGEVRRRIADRVGGLIACARALDERVIRRSWRPGLPLFYRRLPTAGSPEVDRDAAADGWRGAVAGALAAAARGVADVHAVRRLVGEATTIMRRPAGGAAMPFIVDAVAALACAAPLDPAATAAMRKVAAQVLEEAVSGQFLRAAFFSRGAAGTGYEMLVLALAAFVGDVARMREVLERLPMRLAQQVRPDGTQPDAAGAAGLLNLECWGCLAAMTRPLGFDPESIRGDGGPRLRAALARVAGGPATEVRRQAVAHLVGGTRPTSSAPADGVSILPPCWTLALP